MAITLRLVSSGLAIVCGVLVAAAVAADPAPDHGEATWPSLDGRWRDEQRDLTLDIARCGDGVCGQVVARNGACGARALVAAFRTPGEGVMRDAGDIAGGTLDLARRGGTYKVQLILAKPDAAGARSLTIIGGINEEPALYRRIIPLHLVLARIGEAACLPRATS